MQDAERVQALEHAKKLGNVEAGGTLVKLALVLEAVEELAAVDNERDEVESLWRLKREFEQDRERSPRGKCWTSNLVVISLPVHIARPTLGNLDENANNTITASTDDASVCIATTDQIEIAERTIIFATSLAIRSANTRRNDQD